MRGHRPALGAVAVLLASPVALPGARLAPPTSAPPDAHAIVREALAAVTGGSDAAALRTVRQDGIMHEFQIGNAERAEGPWRTSYVRFSELRDELGPRLRRTDQFLSANPAATPAERVTVVTDSVAALVAQGKMGAQSPPALEDEMTRFHLVPLEALRLADTAAALRWEGVVKRYGLDRDVVSMPWRGGRLRIEVGRESRFPDAVEIVRAYPDNIRLAPFGDVAVRAELVNWTRQPSGLWWPMQQKVSVLGEPLRDITVARLTVDSAAPAADSFAVSDSVRGLYARNAANVLSRMRIGVRGQTPVALRDGIVRVPDLWSETLVRQDDGVVLFESHLSEQYFADVLAESGRRFPGTRVKALVLTSDPWAHLGGVRAAVARGIPIYVSAGSVPFLTALARREHSMLPDSQQRVRRAPRFIPVAARTVIGAGRNRIELYPVGGAYGERMLMAYFPEHRLLYGADLVFPNRDAQGKILPGYSRTPVSDLDRAVRREGLAPDSVFTVQAYGPFAWPDVAASVPGRRANQSS